MREDDCCILTGLRLIHSQFNLNTSCHRVNSLTRAEEVDRSILIAEKDGVEG